MSLLFSLSLSMIFFLINCPTTLPARVMPEYVTLNRLSKMTVQNTTATWQNMENYFLINARRGSHVSGISELKKYLNRFGYLRSKNTTLTDEFDVAFESAIVRFQSNHGLSVTGKLDPDTISQFAAPRCGVPDPKFSSFTLHGTKRYVYFPGRPRWSRRMPMTLTYAFSPDYMIMYLSFSDVRTVFKRAFSRWSSVIPVSFAETEDYAYADIKIGFYSGDHGDSEPFDGVLGVLAHSFCPESGKFHLDSAERWAVDFGLEKSTVAIDLESVATHEIGHLLGLAHTPVKEAVMYPSLNPREKKVDLQLDDIQGVQALYGSNPNFTVNSLLESDISTNQAVNFKRTSTEYSSIVLAVLVFSFLFSV